MMYVCIYLYTCLTTYLSIHLFIYLYIYLSTYLPIYWSIHRLMSISTHLQIYLSIYQSICLYICLYIHWSIISTIFLNWKENRIMIIIHKLTNNNEWIKENLFLQNQKSFRKKKNISHNLNKPVFSRNKGIQWSKKRFEPATWSEKTYTRILFLSRHYGEEEEEGEELKNKNKKHAIKNAKITLSCIII